MVKKVSQGPDKEFADLLRVARKRLPAAPEDLKGAEVTKRSEEAEATSKARGQLLEPHRPALVFLADRNLLLESHVIHDGEDFVQDTFMKAFRKLHAFEGTSRPELATWLSVILINTISDFFDSRYCRLWATVGVVLLYDPEGRLAFSVTAGRWPGSDLEREETWQAIHCVLAEVPQTYQRVLDLCYHDGLSPDEAAPYLGRSAGAVRHLRERALTEVRRRLRRRGYTPD